MIYKPFKPPTFVRKPDVQLPAKSNATTPEPPAKKRRISNENDIEPVRRVSKSIPDVSKERIAQRKPLLAVVNPEVAVANTQSPVGGVGDDSTNNAAEEYYNVLWRKYTTKKHKTWDGDGILVVYNGYAHLQDVSGRDMGKSVCTGNLIPGSALSIGGKEVEVDSVIPQKEFLAGKQFLGAMRKTTVVVGSPKDKKVGTKSEIKAEKIQAKQVENVNRMAPKSIATMSKFKNPMLDKTGLPRAPTTSEVPQPRHDPNQADALVMPRPKYVGKGKQIVDVVIDPILGKHLREHQRQGVTFLYECVMGLRAFQGEGAILADEMGLGKTLQTIALLWTLLKQNPVYQDPPVIKKALIVCPVTLINNWRKEFRKWLGNERIGVFVADDKKSRLTDFTLGKAYSIMIVGYEKMRTIQDDLKKGAGVDIVIADEGHRLKTAQNKSAMAIKSLNTERRVILSGTPIQNDLSEFFTMVDFVNPGVLGKYNTFKREFEGPIVRSRQPDATIKDIEKGEARSQELADLTSQFILRRTADILAKYLPPKTEYVLFCRPTTTQAAIYRSIISSPVFNTALGNSEAALQLINILKKVCNSPSLLNPKSSDDAPSELLSSITSHLPPSYLSSPATSAKIRVLDSLLHHLRSTTAEKVVIVSNYTSTLDILGRLLTSLSYPFLRLDGSTPSPKRQPLVDRFNRTPANACFAFLLSAKSGGAGLNLIGASRLILFDVDWNPATDLQAMARIHRDGQKRACHIYRLLVQGGMDEKIFQRQVVKRGLADEVVDGKANMGSFSRDELRDLFRLDEGKNCRTHEILDCACDGKGTTGGPECTSAEESQTEEGAKDGSESGDDDDDDDDDDLMDLRFLRKASQVDMEDQERRLREEKEARRRRVGKGRKDGDKVKAKALMQYAHIDTTWLLSSGALGTDGEAEGDEDEEEGKEVEDTFALEDEVLKATLRDKENRIGFMFVRTTG